MALKILRPLLLLLITQAGLVNAQVADSTCSLDDCCCRGNDPTPAGMMISHVHSKNEWMVSYRFMGMSMQGISQGAASRSESDVLGTYTASPDLMLMNMHMLMAMYGISNKFTLMGMFNYTSSYMEMTMPVGKSLHRHAMSSSGIGDTRLYGLYALIKKPVRQLLVSVGLNLPTGSINHKGEAGGMMYPGQRLPYSMQPGSGTYDLLPGLTYLHQKQKLTYSIQFASTIHTGMNAYGYRLGDELNLNAWGAWQWLSFISSSLRIEGNAAGKIKGRDQALDLFTEPSANPANYGGRRLYAYVGSSIQPKKGFLRSNRLSIEYGLPIYQDLNGIQIKTKHFIYAAWFITF